LKNLRLGVPFLIRMVKRRMATRWKTGSIIAGDDIMLVIVRKDGESVKITDAQGNELVIKIEFRSNNSVKLVFDGDKKYFLVDRC
jgi:sRNA-binding carbon storage regulator CsrA